MFHDMFVGSNFSVIFARGEEAQKKMGRISDVDSLTRGILRHI